MVYAVSGVQDDWHPAKQDVEASVLYVSSDSEFVQEPVSDIRFPEPFSGLLGVERSEERRRERV